MKIFLAILFICSTTFACEIDMDCSWGTICVKQHYSKPGVCVPHETRKNNNPDVYIMDESRGGPCQSQSDCLIGYSCVYLYNGGGICLR